MTTRVAIGPFPETDHDRWPIYQAETLAPEFEVVSFSRWDTTPLDTEVVVFWSPEYQPPEQLRLQRPGQFRACFLGDWHINVPGDISEYDLIATDYRGTKMLRERGIPEDKILWWRGFSFDPRLHFSTEGLVRPTDIAFWGRPDGGKRDHALDDLKAMCQRNGWTWSIRGRTPYKRGEEAAAYRTAKVTWNLSARGELNMRAYEAAACGSLSLIEMDNAELWASGAPLVPWQASTLEEQLRAWLENDTAREAKLREQAAWVAKETPARHLRHLLRAVKQRMEERDGRAERGRVRNWGWSGASEVRPSAVAQPPLSTDVAPPENEQRRELLPLIPLTAKRILDLGTHQGGVPYALKQERPGIHVTGVDLDPATEPLAKGRVDEFHLFNLTADDHHWKEQPWYREGGYDAIILADVVEHVLEPHRLVQSAAPLLAPGGVIVASIPQVRNAGVIWNLLGGGRWELYDHAAPHREWQGPPDNILAAAHVRFFCKADIQDLFDRAGFTVEQWDASYMAAPGMAALLDDLAALIGKYGGDVDGFREAATVIQWIFTAKRKGEA